MSRIIASAAIRGAHGYVQEAETSLTATLEFERGSDEAGVSQHGLLPAADLRPDRAPGQDGRGGPGAPGDRQGPAGAGARRRDVAALPGRHPRLGHRGPHRRGDHRGPALRQRLTAQRHLPGLHGRLHPAHAGHQAGRWPHAGVRGLCRRDAHQRGRREAGPRAAGARHPGLHVEQQRRPQHGRAARPRKASRWAGTRIWCPTERRPAPPSTRSTSQPVRP